MNAYVMHLVEDSQREQPQHRQIFGGRRLRLIDMYSLFAESNDSGADHFAADDIHLNEASFKVYRGYVLRVLEDYLTETR